MSKKKIVNFIVNWTHEWNSEFHEAINKKVYCEYIKLFKEGREDMESIINPMREFYYLRMTNTTIIMIGIVAALLSLASFGIAILALLIAK